MYRYQFVLPLDFSYTENSSIRRSVSYRFPVCTYADELNDVTIQVDDSFRLTMCGIRAESCDAASIKAYAIAEHVCQTLTILMQLQNVDSRESCPSLSYFKYKLAMVLEEEIRTSESVIRGDGSTILLLKERIPVRETVAMTVHYDLDLSGFAPVYENSQKGNFIDVIGTIYQAVRESNVESRFFQLFTIIEVMETHFATNVSICKKLLNDAQVEHIGAPLSCSVGQLALAQKEEQRVRARLMQVLKTATMYSRAEKLVQIIQTFGIREVERGLIAYPIDKKQMEKFIKSRNALFHGVVVQDREKDKFIQTTNELQALCLLLIEKDWSRVLSRDGCDA